MQAEEERDAQGKTWLDALIIDGADASAVHRAEMRRRTTEAQRAEVAAEARKAQTRVLPAPAPALNKHWSGTLRGGARHGPQPPRTVADMTVSKIFSPGD